MPDGLNNHVEHTIKNAREYISPTAKMIAREQQRAVFLDEQGGIDLLKGNVLFVEEAEGGEPLISIKPRVNFSRSIYRFRQVNWLQKNMSYFHSLNRITQLDIYPSQRRR